MFLSLTQQRWRHSTEVASALLTQKSRVLIPALQRFFSWRFSSHNCLVSGQYRTQLVLKQGILQMLLAAKA